MNLLLWINSQKPIFASYTDDNWQAVTPFITLSCLLKENAMVWIANITSHSSYGLLGVLLAKYQSRSACDILFDNIIKW